MRERRQRGFEAQSNTSWKVLGEVLGKEGQNLGDLTKHIMEVPGIAYQLQKGLLLIRNNGPRASVLLERHNDYPHTWPYLLALGEFVKLAEEGKLAVFQGSDYPYSTYREISLDNLRNINISEVNEIIGVLARVISRSPQGTDASLQPITLPQILTYASLGVAFNKAEREARSSRIASPLQSPNSSSPQPEPGQAVPAVVKPKLNLLPKRLPSAADQTPTPELPSTSRREDNPITKTFRRLTKKSPSLPPDAEVTPQAMKTELQKRGLFVDNIPANLLPDIYRFVKGRKSPNWKLMAVAYGFVSDAETLRSGIDELVNLAFVEKSDLTPDPAILNLDKEVFKIVTVYFLGGVIVDKLKDPNLSWAELVNFIEKQIVTQKTTPGLKLDTVLKRSRSANVFQLSEQLYNIRRKETPKSADLLRKFADVLRISDDLQK